MTHVLRSLSLVGVLSLAAACGSDDHSSRNGGMADSTGEAMSGDDATGGAMADDAGDSIVDIAVASDDFTQLVAALQSAELVDTLAGEGPFTVFAPTDAAFAAFAAANPGVLESLSAEELTAVLTYHVLGDEFVSGELVDGSIVPTVQGSYVNVSVGDSVMVNDATVTSADIAASNGVIHVIDSIILPPSADIVETAVAAGDFTQLAGALTSTGLVDVLQGEGPYTVFAPTDAAFAAFEAANPGVLESLDGEQLSDILLYHVAIGYAGAADLSDGMSIPTALEGAELTVDLGDGVSINASSVTQANIIASNGVIHVVDAILLPPSE